MGIIMPHDAKGTKLVIGDLVQVPARVVAIYDKDDYCNCTLELVYRMPPDNQVTTISAINTKQVEFITAKQ